jgi:excisionase family DNA binding protein
MTSLLTTEQVAVELGVKARRVRAMIASGKLPAERAGKWVYLIKRSDLKAIRVRKPGRPPKPALAGQVPGTKKLG